MIWDVMIWDVMNKEQQATWQAHPNGVNNVQLSAHAQQLTTLSNEDSAAESADGGLGQVDAVR